MFAEQIHSRIVLNNLSCKKEYFVIAFYIKITVLGAKKVNFCVLN